MKNVIVHSELHSSDIGASREFYSKLFGWEISDMPMGEDVYGMVNLGENEVSLGFTKTACQENSTFWINYVVVEDIKVAADQARELGAEVMGDIQEVPNMGLFIFLLDPQGGKLALWQKLS